MADFDAERFIAELHAMEERARLQADANFVAPIVMAVLEMVGAAARKASKKP